METDEDIQAEIGPHDGKSEARLMPSPKKYERGVEFKTMAELDAWLRAGLWVYLDKKVQHPGWVWSMQFRTVSNYVERHGVCRALLTPEWKAVNA
jgi:hypothetical protein